MEPLVLESCHSTWLFDTERMRFRRVLKGLDLDNHPASTGWRPYFGLDIEPVSESFVVLLNPEGTRLLRSWRHVEHCAQCGGEATGERATRGRAVVGWPRQVDGGVLPRALARDPRATPRGPREPGQTGRRH